MTAPRDENALKKTWRALREDPRLRRWVSMAGLGLSMGFIVFLLLREREQLSQFNDWQSYLSASVIGFLIYPVALTIHAYIWGNMIARLGKTRQGWRDVEIFAYSHLLRRLPGAVWYLATRSLMYHDLGVKTGTILIASGLEWVWMFAGGLLVAGVCSLQGIGPWLLAFGTLIGILWGTRQLPWLHQTFINWLHTPTAVRGWLQKLDAVAFPQPTDVLLWFGCYIGTYILAGVTLWLLLINVIPEANMSFVAALRVWALTSSASALVVGLLPAGLGVRELTLTALLAPTVPPIAALLVAVLIRILFIAGDLVWGGLMWGVAHFIFHSPHSPETKI